jgi:hypothetical protein
MDEVRAAWWRKRGAYKVLVEIPGRRVSLGKLTRKLKNVIKMDLQEIGRRCGVD